MATTGVNRQPMLVDRPLIEVEVLTTAAVGNRNNDDYRVQGGQGPVLLVDMDSTLTDDDISGGLIDTIEIIRNEAIPDTDVSIQFDAYSNEVTYSAGTIAYIPSGVGFGTLNYINASAPIPIDHVITSTGYSQIQTYVSGNVIDASNSAFGNIAVFTTAVSGIFADYVDKAYFQVLTTSVVTGGGQLPNGAGIYQYSGATISGKPGDTTFSTASGFTFLGPASGVIPSGLGYYKYTGSTISGHSQVAQLTEASGFQYLGVYAPVSLDPYTFTDKSFYFITATGVVPVAGQLPSGPGLYQYRGNTSSGRFETITYTSGNGYYFLGASSGIAPSGYGYYEYTAASPLVVYDQATQFTEAAGFRYISPNLPVAFQELEVCLYHVRQKVNPIANDGDYKFIGKITVASGETRTDGIKQLPHLSIPVPYTMGSLEADKPGRNRGLYLQRGDSLYCGIYATSSTTVNYTPGITVLAQGGYY